MRNNQERKIKPAYAGKSTEYKRCLDKTIRKMNKKN